PGLTPSSARRFSGCTETMRGSPSASASRAALSTAPRAPPPPIPPATMVPSGRMIALAPAFAAVTDTVRTTVASTKASSAALSRATRSITSTCLVMGGAPSAVSLHLSRLRGRSTRATARGGWGEVYPLGQRVLRRHPHPGPPWHAGKGARLRGGYWLDQISSSRASQLRQIGFKRDQAFQRVGGCIEIDVRQCCLDARG